jgi:uncharacterized membrane protein
MRLAISLAICSIRVQSPTRPEHIETTRIYQELNEFESSPFTKIREWTLLLYSCLTCLSPWVVVCVEWSRTIQFRVSGDESSKSYSPSFYWIFDRDSLPFSLFLSLRLVSLPQSLDWVQIKRKRSLPTSRWGDPESRKRTKSLKWQWFFSFSLSPTSFSLTHSLVISFKLSESGRCRRRVRRD